MTFDAILHETDQCNKCGFCLPACPTYQITGSELASPRGRIAMVEALARDEIGVGPALKESLDFCLGCRACETACPSGVHYELILEAGKSRLRAESVDGDQKPWLVREALKQVGKPGRLRRIVGVVRRMKNYPMPRGLKQFTPMLGPIQEVPPVARPIAPASHGSVQFFRGCMMSAVFPEANQAARNLLVMSGSEVGEPEQQTCCGALHWHAGNKEEAENFAKRNIESFEGTPGFIVNTAGGCGAMLLEYGRVLADDPEWRERAERFSARIRDWSTVLIQSDPPLKLRGNGERVTLQNSCHLVNVEQAGDDAVAVLEQIQEHQFTPISGQNTCCGSAGVYNLTHPVWALKILDQKMEDVQSVSPQRILVNNPGCQLQMQWGASRIADDLQVDVEHLATYTYRAAIRGRRES